MRHARYGRMRMGRCVKLDYGHVGCSSDVLDLADSRCSGRKQCIIRIPDALFAQTKPCPDDLKPYMEATFECVRGNTSYLILFLFLSLGEQCEYIGVCDLERAVQCDSDCMGGVISSKK